MFPHLVDHIVSELVRGQVSPQEVSLVPHHYHGHICEASGHCYLVSKINIIVINIYEPVLSIVCTTIS